MIDLQNIENSFKDDTEAVQKWAAELYNKHFITYFATQHDLFVKLESKSQPISDEDLEWILTTLPLELFEAAEMLSQFKIEHEVLKLKIKQIEEEAYINSDETSVTRKKEEAALSSLEHKLVSTVYSSIVNRVESEISFSRELIMGAKKIWDGRRASDATNPVGFVVSEESKLPEYDDISAVHQPKQYIK